MSEQNQKTLLRLARTVIESEPDPKENVRNAAAEVLDKSGKVTLINAH